MSRPLRLELTCLAGCGRLDSGPSTDPPTRPKPPNWRHGMGAKWDGSPLPWTRWAQMDDDAEKHKRHPTVLAADPA